MSDLIVVGFKDEFQAIEMRAKLIALQKEYLIDMEDVVVVTKDDSGSVKLHQAVNLTATGAATGSFWGLLIGFLFMNPILGVAVGAGAGAVSGHFTDVGINDNFMKELGETFEPGSSAIFVLVRKSTPDKVMDALKGFGGTVLQTSLSADNEHQLQEVLQKNS